MTALGHNGGPPIDNAPARKRGRPSSYTPELVDRILDRLGETESLRSICRDPGMPSVRTVLGWVATRPEFRRQYDLARDFGRHLGAEDVLAIADSVSPKPEAVAAARRLIDAKKWHLGRMAPKRRGPRISAPVRTGPRHGVIDRARENGK
jgi:hypothetical protein